MRNEIEWMAACGKDVESSRPHLRTLPHQRQPMDAFTARLDGWAASLWERHAEPDSSLSYVSHTNASKSCCAHSRTFKKGEEEKDDCRVGPATTAGLRKQLRTPVTTGRNLIMENRARCNASIWSLPPVIGRPRLTFSPFFFFFGVVKMENPRLVRFSSALLSARSSLSLSTRWRCVI